MRSAPLWFSESLAPDVEFALRVRRVLFRERLEGTDLWLAETERFGRLLVEDSRILFLEGLLGTFVRALLRSFLRGLGEGTRLDLLLFGGAGLGVAPALLRDPRVGLVAWCPPSAPLAASLERFFPSPPERSPRILPGPGEARDFLSERRDPETLACCVHLAPFCPPASAEADPPPSPIPREALPEDILPGPGLGLILDGSAHPREREAAMLFLTGMPGVGRPRRRGIPSPRLPWVRDRLYLLPPAERPWESRDS